MRTRSVFCSVNFIHFTLFGVTVASTCLLRMFAMDYRFIWTDLHQYSPTNFRMASMNIFLLLVTAMVLTGHFSPPLFLPDRVLPYSYLRMQRSAPTLAAASRPTYGHRYTADQLRNVKPAPLNPTLIPRLKELGIGYHLASRRSCRGGKGRPRKIPVISSSTRQHRTFTFVDTEPWTADLVGVSDLRPRHVTHKNLSRIASGENKNKQNLSKGNLRVASFNAQSLGPEEKRTAVREFVQDWDIDLLFIQETWFKPKGDEAKAVSLAPAGYSVKSYPREHWGGGIAILFKDTLKNHLGFTNQFDFAHKTFELVLLTFSFNKQVVNFACIYRTFPSTKNKLSDKMFFSDGEFPDFLNYFNSLPGSSVILGDINFHFDQPKKTYVARTIDILNDFGFVQSVDQTTQKKGHIIDWVLHRPSENLLCSTQVTQELSSDHFCVVSDLKISVPESLSKTILTRKINKIDRSAFQRDLSARISPNQCQSVEAMDAALVACLDEHAPITSRKLRPRNEDPWYPSIREELRAAKQDRRRAERAWLKFPKNNILHSIFTASKRIVTRLVERARSRYYCEQISECKSSRQLFSISNSLIGKEKSTPLPTSHPLSDLPDIFCEFFLEKTAKIRKELDSQPVSVISSNVSVQLSSALDVFQPVSEEDVRKIIKNSKPTTCPLDPLPTPLLVEFLDQVLPTITNLINDSLRTGIFPQCFKTAVVRPLLKKPSLDQNTLKNYRPVSNLSFLSKVFEKVVLQQLFVYLNKHNLLSHNQSAYRPAHSTETALVKVTNDILRALDKGDITFLTLLDLSAAFDTVDHGILFDTLSVHFGLSGSVLSWFKSYLTERTQSVVIEKFESDRKNVIFGVPQGSVLGPILFLMYTKPLLDSIDRKNIQNQSFADDTQLYRSSKSSNSQTAISDLQNCIQGIREWMTNNKLKLNDDKTEALLFHTKSSFSSFEHKPSSILVGNSAIHFSSSARNLVYMISDDMTLDAHMPHSLHRNPSNQLH